MNRNIYFDCTEIVDWEGHHTGIQRVVAGLLEGLKSLDFLRVKPFYTVGCNAFLLTSNSKLTIEIDDIVITAGSNWDRPGSLQFFDTVSDVGACYVNLFYDLTPILLPHSFGHGLTKSYKTWLDRTISTCSIGVSISENTQKDLTFYAEDNNLSFPDCFKIRLADEIVTKPTKSSSVFQSIKDKEGYALCVGSVEFRKNHITLLNAYRILYGRGKVPPTLVIVGHEGWMNLDIRHQIETDPQLKNNIIMLSSTNDEQLQELYLGSMFTVYPSIYEGWGLPVAESLSYGKPCIASENSSLVEISPDYVLTARTLDPYDWADKIELMAFNHKFRECLSSDILSKYKQTSWQDTARQLISELETRIK